MNLSRGQEAAVCSAARCTQNAAEPVRFIARSHWQPSRGGSLRYLWSLAWQKPATLPILSVSCCTTLNTEDNLLQSTAIKPVDKYVWHYPKRGFKVSTTNAWCQEYGRGRTQYVHTHTHWRILTHTHIGQLIWIWPAGCETVNNCFNTQLAQCVVCNIPSKECVGVCVFPM